MSTASSDQPFSASPAQKLYRDALQSIFQCCSVVELHHIRAVCAHWLITVDSMPSFATSVSCSASSLNDVVHSSLARHIGCFLQVQSARDRRNGAPPLPLAGLDMDLLPTLHQRTPHLHTLSWHIQPPSVFMHALQFPAQLTSLHLNFVRVTGVAYVNPALEAASKLTRLNRLSMEFRFIEDSVFDPLASMSRLSSLSFGEELGPFEPAWTDRQLQAIRACRSLVTLDMPRAQPDTIVRLLSKGVDESAEPFPLLTGFKGTLIVRNDASADALLQRPQLTELGCSFRGNDLAFLQGLPRLRTLHLNSAFSQLTAVTTIAGIAQCHELTSLTIPGSGWLTSADVASILLQCAHISSLKLFRCYRVDSLEFLALPRLSTDLVDLELQYCPAISEACIVWLLPLTCMRRLKLVADGRQTSALFHQNLRTLRARLPALQSLELDVNDAAAQAEIDAILAEE